MSYILDALRRSQVERERGRVPGLDAQPAPADPGDGQRHGLPMSWVASGVGFGLLLLAVLVATWWVQPQSREHPPTAAAPAAVVQQPEPRPVEPTLPQVVSAPPAPVAPPLLPAQSARTTALPGNAAHPPPPVSAQPQPLPPAAPRTLALAELGADQRRELPAMVIGGFIWSDNAASRFVVINGQVIREGEAAAPGVTLERIAPKSATLRWRDLRIEVPL